MGRRVKCRKQRRPARRSARLPKAPKLPILHCQCMKMVAHHATFMRQLSVALHYHGIGTHRSSFIDESLHPSLSGTDGRPIYLDRRQHLELFLRLSEEHLDGGSWRVRGSAQPRHVAANACREQAEAKCGTETTHCETSLSRLLRALRRQTSRVSRSELSEQAQGSER